MKPTAAQSGSDQIDSESFDLTRNINYLLRRAHARADQLFDAEMADLGVTPRQAGLLYGIGLCEGGSISALTVFTGMDRGTVSEMVPRLISRHLIERRPAKEDGRAMALYLTKQGSELVDAVTERTTALQAKVLAPLPSEYRALFMKMLLLMVGLEIQTRTKVDPVNRAAPE